MTAQLNAFIVFVTLMILGVSIAGFLVFANFLNREKERAKRFRARHNKPDQDTKTQK